MRLRDWNFGVTQAYRRFGDEFRAVSLLVTAYDVPPSAMNTATSATECWRRKSTERFFVARGRLTARSIRSSAGSSFSLDEATLDAALDLRKMVRGSQA